MSATGQLLAEWQDKLAIIARNANELSDSECSKRIRNRLRDGRYSGLTRERASVAVQNLTALMDDYLVLARVVEDAVEQNKGTFLSTREGREGRVRELLEGASVELPAVHVPLPIRDLLTSAALTQRTTPTLLLQAMQAAFAEARDVISEIDQVENNFPSALAELQGEERELVRVAESLGIIRPDMPVLDLVVDNVDPLQSVGLVNEKRRILATWSLELTQLEQTKTRAMAAQVRVREQLAQLENLLQERGELEVESAQVFGVEMRSSDPEVCPEHMADLKVWMVNLERHLAEHRWLAVLTGLGHLEEVVCARVAAAKRDKTASGAGLEDFSDLKGRFKALKMKAQVMLGRELVGRSELEELESFIAEGFRVHPVRLALLKQRIAEYEERLLPRSGQNSVSVRTAQSGGNHV